MDLSAQYNEVNRTRFSDPTYAALNNLLEDPGREVTATESSMIFGLGYHLHNTLWSAQTAYDTGLLSREDLDYYRNDLSLFLAQPLLASALVRIYEQQAGKRDAYVFEPLAEFVEKLRAEGAVTE